MCIVYGDLVVGKETGKGTFPEKSDLVLTGLNLPLSKSDLIVVMQNVSEDLISPLFVKVRKYYYEMITVGNGICIIESERGIYVRRVFCCESTDSFYFDEEGVIRILTKEKEIFQVESFL